MSQFVTPNRPELREVKSFFETPETPETPAIENMNDFSEPNFNHDFVENQSFKGENYVEESAPEVTHHKAAPYVIHQPEVKSEAVVAEESDSEMPENYIARVGAIQTRNETPKAEPEERFMSTPPEDILSQLKAKLSLGNKPDVVTERPKEVVVERSEQTNEAPSVSLINATPVNAISQSENTRAYAPAEAVQETERFVSNETAQAPEPVIAPVPPTPLPADKNPVDKDTDDNSSLYSINNFTI